MSAIAIVGMGCRFADAPDLQSYWKLTLEGRDAFSEVPPDRWRFDSFHDTNRRATDKTYAPNGAWIEDVRSFPALALGLPPRRVEVMDPQQRLALEVALQAIEDAGLAGNMPRRTGVFMGVTATEYRVLQASRILATMMMGGELGEPPADPLAVAEAVQRVVPSRPFTAPGVLGNMVAAAVAQELDLHGPAYTTDAACASALVAVADAVTQLRAGIVDAALAGGVYICLTPEHHVAFGRIGAISAEGRCLPFDARADGFVQGDGCGVLLLKRLEDAQRDGDRIYALIEGVATNNDGRGDGPMAPVAEGQADVITTAWADAGVDPAQLGYMEAHGTGTEVGDVTEFTGLMTSIGAQVEHAAIGSSKANIGHTMSAAGIAGMHPRGARHPPPHDPADGQLRDAQARARSSTTPASTCRHPAPAEWDDAHRVAAVSSFGFGGTNGHVVLRASEAPEVAGERAAPSSCCMSGCDEEALRDLAARTADAIEDRQRGHRGRRSPRLGQSAQAARPPRHRRAGQGRARREAAHRRARGQRVSGASIGTSEQAPRIAFLYPGQGSQRIGMLAGVRDRFPVARAHARRDRGPAQRRRLDVPLTHLLYPERRSEVRRRRHRLCRAHPHRELPARPAARLRRRAAPACSTSVGVTPHVVVGHSLGEFTAAAAGGVLEPADAARFVAEAGSRHGQPATATTVPWPR